VKITKSSSKAEESQNLQEIMPYFLRFGDEKLCLCCVQARKDLRFEDAVSIAMLYQLYCTINKLTLVYSSHCHHQQNEVNLSIMNTRAPLVPVRIGRTEIE
jgi:hypothetical protein